MAQTSLDKVGVSSRLAARIVWLSDSFYSLLLPFPFLLRLQRLTRASIYRFNHCTTLNQVGELGEMFL